MSNKLNQRARALAKKANISFHAAKNRLQAANNHTVAPLLERLHAEPFQVVVGRVPAIGRSASLEAASAQAARLAASPMLYAESGSASMQVTPHEAHALIHCGAADANATQIIRSFHNDKQITFSDHCDNCRRWIWCATDEREGTCFCGHPYRVVFDLAPVRHWTKPQNARCMDCGIERIPHPVERGISPWHPVNEGQSRCNPCHEKAAGSTAAPADGVGMFLHGDTPPKDGSGAFLSNGESESGVFLSGEAPMGGWRIGPVQLQLLREATRGACPVCGKATGIQPAEDGNDNTTTIGPGGFEIHVTCVGKPIRLPDGAVLT